jgi:hypothetical protein
MGLQAKKFERASATRPFAELDNQMKTFSSYFLSNQGGGERKRVRENGCWWRMYRVRGIQATRDSIARDARAICRHGQWVTGGTQ